MEKQEFIKKLIDGLPSSFFLSGEGSDEITEQIIEPTWQEAQKEKKIYSFLATYDSYDSQTIVVIANTVKEAEGKIKAYLEKNSKTVKYEIKPEDLEEKTEDVFETYGVDG